MREHTQTVAASIGGVVAALLGSLCCAGPVLFATLGLGAGLAGQFEPLRPLFGLVMLAAFGIGYQRAYGRPRAESSNVELVEDGEGGAAGGAICAVPTDRRRDRVLFWSAAALALALWTYPQWSWLLV